MTTPLAGILVLDKPRGITSMDAVAQVRRRAGGAKTGHAGTLDPLATGVLVIALGAATKSINRLMATDKRYQTTIDLSAFTTTDDLEGERREVFISRPPDEQTVRSILLQFIGEIVQRPPAFSAVNIGGQRAYQLARRGNPVDIAPRSVVIHSILMTRYAWPLLDLEIHCNKGVYVRSLARDIGTALETGGHCTAIRRTAVGPFTLAIALEVQTLPSSIEQQHLLPIEQALDMIAQSSDVDQGRQ